MVVSQSIARVHWVLIKVRSKRLRCRLHFQFAWLWSQILRPTYIVCLTLHIAVVYLTSGLFIFNTFQYIPSYPRPHNAMACHAITSFIILSQFIISRPIPSYPILSYHIAWFTSQHMTSHPIVAYTIQSYSIKIHSIPSHSTISRIISHRITSPKVTSLLIPSYPFPSSLIIPNQIIHQISTSYHRVLGSLKIHTNPINSKSYEYIMTDTFIP